MVDDKIYTFNSGKLSFKAIDGKKGKEYYVEGYISTEDLDLVNDIVTKDCMLNMMEQFNGRTIKLDFEHEAFRGKDKLEGDLNKTKLPLGKAIKRTMDNKGLKVKWQLNPTWKKLDEKSNVVMTFKELWSNVEDGYYDAFSIAYIPVKSRMNNLNGIEARMLDEVGLLNVALTGNPVNTHANMTAVMAKSLAWLKDRESETMKQEKRETKSYDKDGAHAHTEENPIGEHSHPEIEKAIQSVDSYIDRRIDYINDRIDNLRTVDNTPEKDSCLKSKKKGDIVTDTKDDTKTETAEVKGKETDKKTETQEVKDQKTDESTEIVEVKSRLDTLETQLKAKDDEIKKLNEILDTPQFKSIGAANKADKKAETETKDARVIKGPLDLI
ncbi:hypothetical protein GQ473_01790 [archaeon]|nr:hypothetical protein [archaeon]